MRDGDPVEGRSGTRPLSAFRPGGFRRRREGRKARRREEKAGRREGENYRQRLLPSGLLLLRKLYVGRRQAAERDLVTLVRRGAQRVDARLAERVVLAEARTGAGDVLHELGLGLGGH